MCVNHENHAEYVRRVNTFLNDDNKTQVTAMALELTTYIPPWILLEFMDLPSSRLDHKT